MCVTGNYFYNRNRICILMNLEEDYSCSKDMSKILKTTVVKTRNHIYVHKKVTILYWQYFCNYGMVIKNKKIMRSYKKLLTECVWLGIIFTIAIGLPF